MKLWKRGFLLGIVAGIFSWFFAVLPISGMLIISKGVSFFC